MAKLPTDVSGQQLVKALERVGFVVSRQRGSHIIMRRNEPYGRAVVPNHRVIRLDTLRQILQEAGLSADQLRELL